MWLLVHVVVGNPLRILNERSTYPSLSMKIHIWLLIHRGNNVLELDVRVYVFKFRAHHSLHMLLLPPKYVWDHLNILSYRKATIILGHVQDNSLHIEQSYCYWTSYPIPIQEHVTAWNVVGVGCIISSYYIHVWCPP